MPGLESKSDLVSTLLEGVCEAQKVYEVATGDEWLWQAPEYLICVTLLNLLSKKNVYVTLEQSVRDVIRESGVVRRGARPREIRSNGRHDLVIWSKGRLKGKPRVAVEVKNQVTSYNQIEEDLKRLKMVVSRYSRKAGPDHNLGRGSFQFGAMVFYTSVNSESKDPRSILADRIDRIFKHAKKNLSSTLKISGDSQESIIKRMGKHDAWAACCFVIEMQ